MKIDELETVAQAMVTPGKGILAADESTPTIKKRLDQVGVESTENNRRMYRNLLFTTNGAEEFISGVILFDETIYQSTIPEKIPFPDYLSKKGIIPGIKVDKGAKPLAGYPEEKITEGLDGLRDRLIEYYDLGARFAKWRAVITIGEKIPSLTCLQENAHALARYAALCQEANLVPIVEPEVLMDGEHNIQRSFEVTTDTLQIVFEALYREGILFEGMILKPNMVLSGYDCSTQASVQDVAEETVRCLLRVVPAAVPGICFLSGGQSDILATDHLNAMNKITEVSIPWALSFSYGRALQQQALKAWSGDPSNIPFAQKVFYHRAKCNGAATQGDYNKEIEEQIAIN